MRIALPTRQRGHSGSDSEFSKCRRVDPRAAGAQHDPDSRVPVSPNLPLQICKETDMTTSTRALSGSLWLALLIAVPAGAQIDANSLKASARHAASYESGRSTGSRMGFTGPEGSGRPGIYYFKKAVKAFDKDQYAFAIDMYEVSASWAYKPAQYNLSVMYARGHGVPVDLPRAAAWIALAAERGDSRYISARDAIVVSLDSEQVETANRILEQLKPKYADERALKKAKRRWRDTRRDVTGSRLGFVGSAKIGGVGNSTVSAGNDMINPADFLGSRINDASIEFHQLQDSDGPYEPSDRVLTGVVTVNDLIIPDLSKSKSPATTPADGSEKDKLE